MERVVDDMSIAEAVKVSLLGLNHDIGTLFLNIPLRLLLRTLLTLTRLLRTDEGQLIGRILLELVGFGSEFVGVTLAVSKGLEKLNFGDVPHAAVVCGNAAVHHIHCFLLVWSDFLHWPVVVRHLEIWF